MNDPWATDPPKITPRQIHQVVGLIADYTEPEAAELIRTLTSRRAPKLCCDGFVVGIGTHRRTCPTRGDNS